MQGFGRASRTGNHVYGSGACAAEILVRQIEKLLVVRVGMNGGHGAAVNAKGVLENFGDRGQAIRGARGVGNDVMFRGIVGLVVDAENERSVRALGWGGDDDFFDRAPEMLCCLGAIGEETGGFNHDIRSDAGPINFDGIFYLENLERLAFDGDRVVRMRDVVGEITENGVVLEQMREGLGVGNVVDRDELDVFVIERGAHDVASDAAEAVDANLDGHYFLRWDFETAAGSPRRSGRKVELKMLWAAERKVNAKQDGPAIQTLGGGESDWGSPV